MNTAIVLAGGSGRRMNSDIPKQYMMLKGKPVIYYSLKAFQDNLHIDDIILVTSDHYIEYVKKNILDDTLDKVSKVIQGGVERYDSVWEGLKCIKESGYVFIHDGARPCISQKLINDCYEAVVEDGACIAAVPVKDTIKIADSEGYAAKTPDRNTLWQIQTPQVFSASLICYAYEELGRREKELLDRGIQITDDAMVVEEICGRKVRLTEGSYENMKLTTPEDLEIAETFLRRKNR